jgi:hypothetical protein
VTFLRLNLCVFAYPIWRFVVRTSLDRGIVCTSVGKRSIVQGRGIWSVRAIFTRSSENHKRITAKQTMTRESQDCDVMSARIAILKYDVRRHSVNFDVNHGRMSQAQMRGGLKLPIWLL